jgi:hypothetical protein
MPGMLFRGWLAIRYYKMNGLGKQNSAAHDSGRESETLCYVGRKKKIIIFLFPIIQLLMVQSQRYSRA